MSNPNSPSGNNTTNTSTTSCVVGGANDESGETGGGGGGPKSETTSETSGGGGGEPAAGSSNNNVVGNGGSKEISAPTPTTTPAVPHFDPVVRLNPFVLSEAQIQAIKKNTGNNSSGELSSSRQSSAKSQEGSGGGGSVIISGSSGGEVELTEIKMEVDSDSISTSTQSPIGFGMDNATTTEADVIPIKTRRLSVHFAEPAVTNVVEVDPKSKIGVVLDRVKQENSRKHRSRKEKLVCRSESPTDIAMGAGTSQTSSLLAPPLAGSSSAGSSKNAHTHAFSAKNELLHQGELLMPTSNRIPPPPSPVVVRARANSVKARPRPPAKRLSSASRASGNTPSGSSRRCSPVLDNSIKEPVKKKKVIEIVSPRKRKLDHIDLMKTSSDPIFVRAANKPFKLKHKSHRRLKFSRSHFKSSGGSRVRHDSSASFQQSSSGQNMQKFNVSPQKKEKDEPLFPTTLVDDLLWTVEEAEKEFRSDGLRVIVPPTVSSQPLSSVPETLDPAVHTVPTTAAEKRLLFGRRRVESEPTSAGGFDFAPSSPSAPQSFYHLRKEIYFSPSPSYTAPGPTGRRRYSRRRHARIHPPFDNTNCSFQNHLCPNSKIPGSQYCEKHLDQGPTSDYSHCRHIKDNRQCGNVFSSYDPGVTFCEEHAFLVAKTEYDTRNPIIQPDPAKNICARMNKILTDGLTKTNVEKLDISTPLILQITEDPDIIQELPLGKLTGVQLDECDTEGERNINPDKPDYDALKNAGYFTTEEIIQIHINKLRKLKALYQREKELEWMSRQHKFRFFKEGLEKLKQYEPRFTTNPYLIDKFGTDLPSEYIDFQIKQYEAAKAILQTAYRSDGQRGLLRMKILKTGQELEKMAKATGQKQQDTAETYDSESDVDSDSGEPRDRRESSRYAGIKPAKCAYNEGYAIRACPNHPVYRSHFCLKHILSDPKQVLMVPCNRRVGPDPQDICKTPVLKILEEHGCALHAPHVLTKFKPLKRSEENISVLGDSDNEEDEVQLEEESPTLENLVSDECIKVNHLESTILRLGTRGPLDITDTSDSEETDEEGIMMGLGIVSNTEENDISELDVGL